MKKMKKENKVSWSISGYERYSDYIEPAIKRLYKDTDRFTFENGKIVADDTHHNKARVREILTMASRLYFTDKIKEKYFFENEFEKADPGIFASGPKKEGADGYDIEYSSILSALIKEAGVVCDMYASDLFISWNAVDEQIKTGKIDKTMFLFGFRQLGVDHEEYIRLKLENPDVYGYDIYDSIFVLMLREDFGTLEMELKCIF